MAEAHIENKETTKNKIKEPKKFKVIVLNDSFTPFDFVIVMLIKVFNHSEGDARDITSRIHNDGSAVAGIYNYEIAEQKGMEATALARENGHPLQLKIESE